MSEEQSKVSNQFEELLKLDRKLDQQMKELGGNLGQESSASSKGQSGKKILLTVLVGLLGLLLPFIALIRVSVYVYLNYQFNGWFSLSIGVGATVLSLLSYGVWLSYKLRGRVRIHRYVVRGVLALVIAYSSYGLLYYSSLNTKTDEVASYYRSLHPIMRIALTTITLADSEMVITDIQRIPKDYAKMGLPVNQQSLHYVQEDGYVHAADLRTRGKAAWKNWLVQNTFQLIGIKTIRHVGTADHLHIYLPMHQ